MNAFVSEQGLAFYLATVSCSVYHTLLVQQSYTLPTMQEISSNATHFAAVKYPESKTQRHVIVPSIVTKKHLRKGWE
jgi:hypothetical protein